MLITIADRHPDSGDASRLSAGQTLDDIRALEAEKRAAAPLRWTLSRLPENRAATRGPSPVQAYAGDGRKVSLGLEG